MDDTTKPPGQPRPGDPARDPTPRNEAAPLGHNTETGPRGGRTSAGNRQGQYSAPLRVDGYPWRKARGLLTWRDYARRWRFGRATPAGCLCPLPGTRTLPRWRPGGA